MDFHITTLGTSAGVPTRHRNVSACVLASEASKAWFLVDCGEGTQHRLLDAGYSLNRLEAICITHVHGDHCYGLPGLLATMGMQGRKKALTIIAHKNIEIIVQTIREHSDLYIPFDINFVFPGPGKEVHETLHLKIQSIALSHRVDSFAYLFIEQNIEKKLDMAYLNSLNISPGPIFGQIKRGEEVRLENGQMLDREKCFLPPRSSRRLIISGDNDDPSSFDDFPKPDVLVHEATFTEEDWLRVGIKSTHTSGEQISRYAEEKGISNLVLTHFSPRYHDYTVGETLSNDVMEEAKKHYFGSLFMAQDLTRFRLDEKGELHQVTRPE